MTQRHSSWTLFLSVGSIIFVLACRSSNSGSGSTSGKSDTDEAPIGIGPCDEYLKKVARCIAEHAPPNKREALQKNLTQTHASWTALAANPGTRPSLGQSCGFALKSAKATMQALSCEW